MVRGPGRGDAVARTDGHPCVGEAPKLYLQGRPLALQDGAQARSHRSGIQPGAGQAKPQSLIDGRDKRSNLAAHQWEVLRH